MDNGNWREVLSNNLSSLRKKSNLTQSELGCKLNYSDKSVSKWERGDGVPDLSVMVQLSDLYGTSIDEMLGRSQAKTNKPKAQPIIRHATAIITYCSIVFLVALTVFACLTAFVPGIKEVWLCFLGALPVMALGAGILFIVWKNYVWAFGVLSIALWTACLFLQQIAHGLNAGLLYAISGIIQLIALVVCGFKVMRRVR